MNEMCAFLVERGWEKRSFDFYVFLEKGRPRKRLKDSEKKPFISNSHANIQLNQSKTIDVDLRLAQNLKMF